MRKKYQYLLISLFAILALLASALGVGFTFARGNSTTASQVGISAGGKAATARMVSMHVVNMSTVPVETAKQLSGLPTKKLPLAGTDPALYAQWKKAAAQNKNAPLIQNVQSALPKTTSAGFDTPVLPLDFGGLPTQPLSVPSLVAASRLIWRWLHLRTGYFRASIPHLPFTAQAVHFNPAGRRPRRASLVSLILEAAIVEVHS